ncbi:MAG: hypothetical protein KME49_00325 [Brasilonema octagenarum HA4186-MV1]|nr:hypothetical protein [Brasilonema octagenarum HA4186-MV1]
MDGTNSLPVSLDGQNPNLGRNSACRRVTRTIYLGSAPTLRAANRGLEDRRIKLGSLYRESNACVARNDYIPLTQHKRTQALIYYLCKE